MNKTKITVVGGIYLEKCMRPHWNDYFGSGGRAAFALARMESEVALYGYADNEASECLKIRSNDIELNLTKVESSIHFHYTHGLATPSFNKIKSINNLKIEADNILRFGIIEGEAVVNAKSAVYDPQDPHNPQSFRQNGSSADRLALVLNRHEARLLLKSTVSRNDEETVRLLAEQEGAEVVVMKRGPMGALVYENGRYYEVPAYKTKRVWKIGSGDMFAALFSLGWMQYGESAHRAAMRASKATAFYCENKTPPTQQDLDNFTPDEIKVGKHWKTGKRYSVYLAGPFFSLAQLWLVEEAKDALSAMQLNVLSPYHEIGLGSAMDVVPKDLKLIEKSDLVFALCDGFDPGTVFEIGYARKLKIPVVVLSEMESAENLKMMEGSGCKISDDFVSSIYHTLWEIIDA